jgi:hypothetical protein
VSKRRENEPFVDDEERKKRKGWSSPQKSIPKKKIMPKLSPLFSTVVVFLQLDNKITSSVLEIY